MSAATNVRQLSRVPDATVDEGLPNFWDHFKPHRETQVVAAQQTRGIFVPYPLLAILAPILMLLIGGVIGLCTTVYSMNGSLTETRQKNAQLEVYIHDDREKLIRLQDKVDELLKGK